jgi:hypothetical protein
VTTVNRIRKCNETEIRHSKVRKAGTFSSIASLTYQLDELAEATRVITSQRNTIKTQGSRLKRQTQSRVKDPAVVEPATDADSESPVRRKRKRTEDNHRLGVPIENL